MTDDFRKNLDAPSFVRGGALSKSRHGLTLLHVLSRKMEVGARGMTPEAKISEPLEAAQTGVHEAVVSRNQNAKRHCIVLHGWASSGDESRDLWQAVRELPQAANWNFWDVTYDSQWTTFDQSAARIVEQLRHESIEYSNEDTSENPDIILIGNSMGGVVARQMVALGFPCRALISICSPHLGPAPWIPVPNRGPRSIARNSSLLAQLNSNETDRAHRNRYHFFAITYRDVLGSHDHDGIITAPSALGLGLGRVAQRQRIHLLYRTLATFDPHWRGRFAAHIPPVVQTLEKLMVQER
jgi:pimeloyl-ACP methyl ester carboxylesterase